MKKLLNYTPHPINLFIGDEEIILPSMGIARVEEVVTSLPSTKFEIEGKIVKVPCVNKYFSKYVTGLPPKNEDLDGNDISDCLYIVSALVKSATYRQDVVGIGEFKRDSQGKIIGAFSLDVNREQIQELLVIPPNLVKVNLQIEEEGDYETDDDFYVVKDKVKEFPRSIVNWDAIANCYKLAEILKEKGFKDGEVFYENYPGILEDIFHLS
jgi:hypothetical protein